ncbi:histidine kinase [Pseudorhizobium endolithicum]|uniref:Histidine kinase n=1 Tax=Pseudorhizobium endolithicum TaxID=1191678 RepID=A0ABM8PGH4_9HYPH|nr:DUF294 nucleotidyltransferase-like domain-containing protein [Pseudorhizobium endolithicum]CAD7028528.1 histidine kinase [Pseudorhizobium endolithicum]
MDFADFVRSVHPYDSLPREELERVVARFNYREFAAGEQIYARGEWLSGLYLIQRGSVEVADASGTVISQLFPRNSLGERGLLADGFAPTTARAATEAGLLILPAPEFRRLMAQQPVFARFFNRGRQGESRRAELATQKVGDLMSRPAATCGPEESIRDVARAMAERHVSCLAVVENERLVGIVTTRDLVNRVIAAALDPAATAVSAVMTKDPVALGPDALGSDVLSLMFARSIGHVPVVDADRVLGMITQTDLTRFEAVSATRMITDIAEADVEKLPEITAQIPQLLVQLVGAGNPPETVSRLITDITDAVTRRLLSAAEERLGPPPVPYVWLACGSQGRQEQTGKTDQDNCIILSDDFREDDRPWYTELARFVSDNLHACGYVYCPGDMMATNLRWCQPVRVWSGYFESWIAAPQPMAQMLASVMFDLRPIYGLATLFEDLNVRTLRKASENSIFVAHMIRNSLSHAPPLGLLRGFATVSAGEHRNQIDLKLNGVVPIIDLARVYALIGQLAPVNTRARLLAAEEQGVISSSGGRDLLAAYDLISECRLKNQAAQVKAGQRPDNFLAPYELGDFERSHLRDAFVVVRTMQSALAHGRSALF